MPYVYPGISCNPGSPYLFPRPMQPYMKTEHVAGRDRGPVLLYALSTCGWCRKTKELLQSLGVAYDFVYVDLLPPGEQEEALKAVEVFNPRCSFPTLVLGKKQCIVGFREGDIREALY